MPKVASELATSSIKAKRLERQVTGGFFDARGFFSSAFSPGGITFDAAAGLALALGLASLALPLSAPLALPAAGFAAAGFAAAGFR